MRPIQAQRDTFALRLAMPWYHTTDSELNPGDEILPASKRGVPNRWESKDYNPNLVYFTEGPQRLSEEHLNNSPFGKHTYEVEPQGDIQRDPEWESNKKSYGGDYEYESDVPGAQDYAAPSAKVIRKYHPDNWRQASALDDYRMERHRQEVEMERQTGGYSADKADYLARGGQPTITYKDWLKSRKKGPGEQAAEEAGVDPDFHYVPDSSWGGEAPSWLTASRWYTAGLRDWEERERREQEAGWSYGFDKPQDLEYKPHDWQRDPATSPEGTQWHHVSLEDLKPGTVIKPGGGSSQWSTYRSGPNEARGQWTWMDTPDKADWWDESGRGHVYEVKPSQSPHPWNNTGTDGWVAPSATVVRKIRGPR